MVEELAVEMVAPRKRNFWLTGKGIAIIAASACVVLAALLSWWLANGTVKSSLARLDTMVFTVEPEFSTHINRVLVAQGDLVQSGQPLATIDVSSFLEPNPDTSGLIPARLNMAMQTERDLAAKANQARADEERTQKIYQDMVTNHVRAQLAMRSARSQAAYAQAAELERVARARMNEANDTFEQTSRGRAALEQELRKIRNQLLRSGVKPEMFKSQPVQAVQDAPKIPEEIFAPVAGRIMQIEAHNGQNVEKGQTLFIILPTGQDYVSNLWVEAWFPANDAPNIKTGQKALVKFSDKIHLEGKVQEIAPPISAPAGQTNLGSAMRQQNPDQMKFLPVRIELDHPSDARSIQPGTKAECQIQTRYLLGLTWFN